MRAPRKQEPIIRVNLPEDTFFFGVLCKFLNDQYLESNWLLTFTNNFTHKIPNLCLFCNKKKIVKSKTNNSVDLYLCIYSFFVFFCVLNFLFSERFDQYLQFTWEMVEKYDIMNSTLLFCKLFSVFILEVWLRYLCAMVFFYVSGCFYMFLNTSVDLRQIIRLEFEWIAVLKLLCIENSC